jgi:hypothetical protein
MAKTSTPENSVKIVDLASGAFANEVSLNGPSSNEQPSARIITNILNYSKALEVKTSGSGKVITVVKN